MTEHWLQHVRKLIEAGVPLQRVARSLRTASMRVDDDWFKWVMDDARKRFDALGPHEPVHREEAAPADVSLTPEANHSEVPDAARVATEESLEPETKPPA
jgi:hypothetical protein